MSSIFCIDKKLIQSVDDETARELVARLCKAELRAQGLPESSVGWGGDQRAKDGGVDVLVECSVPLVSADFVPAANTVIQVKAEKFNPAKIAPEMAPKGILRLAIMNLTETGGAYLIVSTKDDASYEALEPRREAMRKCLVEHGMAESVKIDFYDSRRIADWVEQHPAIATWLRDKLGQSLKGWRPYGPWAYKEEDVGAEYLIDNAARILLPSNGNEVDISEAIVQLRKDLRQPISIRLVGLSGVGKTRLVQALFDEKICAEAQPPSCENVIYTDLAEDPEPQPYAMIESLQSSGSDAVVVIDNCGSETHNKLTELIKRKVNRLRLITIEYDIRDEKPEGTRCYRLEGSSLEMIKKLVRRNNPQLSCVDADRIAEFSDGNARVAYVLASSVQAGGELSQLGDSEMFRRLFWQKKGVNDELLKCAESASLLYSFDWDDSSSTGELALLAEYAEVSIRTFKRNMAELQRRGLLQARGHWRAVLPHAVANGLAKRMLDSASGEELYRSFIEDASERVARSFCRRLGFLHDCPEVVTLASRMFAEDGRLGNLTALSDFEEQMFSNLAPVDPQGVLDVIERTGPESIPSFRSRYSRVVRSIAYDSGYFEKAIAILLRVALTEPVSQKQDSVRNIVVSFFYCYLSYTHASPS